MQATGLSRETAERVVRKNMQELPFWDKNPAACLIGEVVTDEEFEAILSQLG